MAVEGMRGHSHHDWVHYAEWPPHWDLMGPSAARGPHQPQEDGVRELLPAQLPRAVCKAGLLTSTSVGPFGGRPTDLVPSFLTSLMALLVLHTLPKQFAQPVGQWVTLKGSPEGRLGGQWATLGPWAWPLLPLLVRSFALYFAFSWPI